MRRRINKPNCLKYFSTKAEVVGSQGCTLAAPGGPLLLTLLGDKKILVCLYIVQIYYAEHPGFLKLRALGSLHFLLEHSHGLNPIEAQIFVFQSDLQYLKHRMIMMWTVEIQI